MNRLQRTLCVLSTLTTFLVSSEGLRAESPDQNSQLRQYFVAPYQLPSVEQRLRGSGPVFMMSIVSPRPETSDETDDAAAATLVDSSAPWVAPPSEVQDLFSAEAPAAPHNSAHPRLKEIPKQVMQPLGTWQLLPSERRTAVTATEASENDPFSKAPGDFVSVGHDQQADQPRSENTDPQVRDLFTVTPEIKAAVAQQTEPATSPSEPGRLSDSPSSASAPLNQMNQPPSETESAKTEISQTATTATAQKATGATAAATAATPIPAVKEAAPATPATETAAAPASPSSEFKEELKKRRQQTEEAELEAELKTQLLAHYQKANEFLKQAEEAQKKIAHYQELIQKAPLRKEELRALLQQELPKPNSSNELSLAAADQLLITERLALSELNKQVERIDNESKTRHDRKLELPTKLEEAKKNLAKTEQTIKGFATSGEPPLVILARQTEQEAYAESLRKKILQYPIEQTYYSSYSDVFPLEKDYVLRQRKHQSQLVEILETTVAKARQKELELQAAEARRALQDAHPALKKLAERNAELTEKRATYLEYLKQTTSELEEIRHLNERIHSKFEDAQEKEARTGLTTTIGLHLRNEKHHLPSEVPYLSKLSKAENEIIRLQGELIELEEQRNYLGDISASVDYTLARISKSDQHMFAEEDLKEMAAELLQDRRTYLNDLIADLEQCLHNQGELAAQQKSLSEEIVNYRSHIDERILWIRSAEMLDGEAFKRTGNAIQDIFEVEKWLAVGNRLTGTATQYPFMTGGFLLLCVLLIAMQGKFRQKIVQTGEGAAENSTPKASQTVLALGLTALVSCVWPALIWSMGYQLTLTSEFEEFSYSLGRALQVMGVVFGSIELFRQFCRPGGIAERHVLWPVNAVRGVHRNLVSLLWVGLPLVFCLELANDWKDGLWSDSFGRIAFILAMGWFSWCLHRMLQPRGPIFQDVVEQYDSPAFDRFLQTGYFLAVASTLFLAGLAIAGYHYTAQQLFIRLELTMWLAIVLIVGYSFISNAAMRAHVQLMEIRNRLHKKMRHARKQRRRSAEQQVADEVAEQPTDTKELTRQIQKIAMAAGCLLFLMGSWHIWAEVTPALQRINGIELWQTTVQATQALQTETGTNLVPTTQSVPITLGHLLFSLGVLALTIVAAGNLPGLMELALLRRLPLDKGGRNAVTTLTRYAISVLGGLMVAKNLGIHWSSVQWLVAALTVGLGFGLQEIFANFISGLIILFERPVRIGDTITIDGVTGTVTRIQIRATTIRDFDRKEYLVPNKEFVTGRLLNWTLSDQVNRIIVNVGVAHGSDTELARELMLKAARSHPRVMNDPAPSTSFESFGNSALNLCLRCFLPDLDGRLDVITQLHTQINQEFTKAGIKIPFPQMDLHIRQPIAVAEGEKRDDSESKAA